MRSEEDLVKNPCKFVIKNIEPVKRDSITINTEDGKSIKKVKKRIQKRDENGELVFEEKTFTRSKGCGCKGKKKETITEVKKVPVMEDAWVEVEEFPVVENQEEYVLCKLYGKVKKSFCQKCTTYKKK